MTACEEVDELYSDCAASTNALTRKENSNRDHKRSVQMPKHFQTVALHWFICFVNHNLNNPQISLVGREGGVGRRNG